MSRNLLIGIIVVVLLLVGAAALILNNRNALSPEEVTKLFVEEWVKQSRAQMKAPFDAGLHNRSTYVTESFGNSIDQYVARMERVNAPETATSSATTTVATGTSNIATSTPSTPEPFIDPIFCSERPPESLEFALANAQSERARVNVVTEQHTDPIEVFLINDNGWWRIDEIECPSRS